MQISHLTGSDSANYTCRAENVYGSTEATFFLEVVGKKKKNSIKHPARRKAKLG